VIDSRKGECLWSEWSGEGYTLSGPSSIVFHTNAHVDLDIDVVKRALASSLQRDGVVVSLGAGYAAIESSVVTHGYSGFIGGEIFPSVCNLEGVTFYETNVDDIYETTWVEIR
jgi:hypothetical protein